MMLTDLADACRKSGLTVIEELGWKTRGHAGMKSVSAIVCHHTAGPKTGDTPSLGVVKNGRPGLPGPLSQLYLSRSGAVHVVAAGLSYHAGATHEGWQDNDDSIGIEAEHDGLSPWPAYEYDCYVRLVRALCDHYGVPVSKVLGHKEIAKPKGRKTDPNFDMDEFRRDIEGVSSVDWNYQINDYYRQGLRPIPFREAVAWGTTHAAHARDRATESRDEVRALRQEVRDLRQGIEQAVAQAVAQVLSTYELTLRKAS